MSALAVKQSIKIFFATGLVLFLLGTIAMWLWSQEDYISPDFVRIDLSASITKANTCSRVSPEFSLGGIPAQASLICFSIKELDTEKDYGGGCIRAPGTKNYKLNPGALIDYIGPCPETGPRSYLYRVEALSDLGVVVGLGSTKLSCCSNLVD